MIVAGLGFGANQNVYTAVSFLVLAIIIARGILTKKNSALFPNDNLNVEIQWEAARGIDITTLIDKLADLSVHVSLPGSDSWNRVSVQVSLTNNISAEDVVNVLNQFGDELYQISNAGMDGSGSIYVLLRQQRASRIYLFDWCYIAFGGRLLRY